MILLATLEADQTLTSWVIVAVAGGILAVLGFLVRNAFEDTTQAVKDLGAEVKSMRGDLAKGDGDRRVLERDVLALTHRTDKLEREVRELSEGVAR